MELEEESEYKSSKGNNINESKNDDNSSENFSSDVSKEIIDPATMEEDQKEIEEAKNDLSEKMIAKLNLENYDLRIEEDKDELDNDSQIPKEVLIVLKFIENVKQNLEMDNSQKNAYFQQIRDACRGNRRGPSLFKKK